MVMCCLLKSSPGPQQGHSHSQRGCSGNAGQLRPGLLPDEVLHGAHERLQECGLGVRQQQAGPEEGRVLHGDGRDHRVCAAHLDRCVSKGFVCLCAWEHMVSLNRIL